MQKVIMTLLCFSVSIIAARAQDGQTTVNPDAGKFSFKEQTHDYGTVPEGPTAEYDFVFKNTGKSPIVITEAHGSCGCTTPTWPKDPILPKHKGVIHVTYNTNHRPGAIDKDVIIISNAQQEKMVLHIKGTVKPASEATAMMQAGK